MDVVPALWALMRAVSNAAQFATAAGGAWLVVHHAAYR
jgi:hypothetical protein